MKDMKWIAFVWLRYRNKVNTMVLKSLFMSRVQNSLYKILYIISASKIACGWHGLFWVCDKDCCWR